MEEKIRTAAKPASARVSGFRIFMIDLRRELPLRRDR
jgi:hypothetical protein